MSSSHHNSAEDEDNHSDDEVNEELFDAMEAHAAQKENDGSTDAASNVGEDYDADDESVGPSILEEMSDDSDSGDDRERREGKLLKQKYNQQLRRNRKLLEDTRQLRLTIQERNNSIAKLEERIGYLTNGPPPPVSWRKLLRDYLNKGEEGEVSYNEVYRECCRQENMSMKLDVFHPDFSLSQMEAEPARQAAHHEPHDPVQAQAPTLPFERLPVEIQARIFKLILVKRKLIHCLSRLDPVNQPRDFPPEDEDGHSQLPTGFHFGSKPCVIIRARKPNNVLAPLLVCKRWFFIGAHVFYGANTFAFSSLGEWYRFCNGVGAARVERLVNVELLWHGNLMPKHESRISQRTIGLAWFERTKRLRTLVVHIAECSKDRMRRKYEMENPGDYCKNYTDSDEFSDGDLDDAFQLMLRRTDTHPNYRKFRSMRTVQGIDYIYQLRGMNWVRFKERNGLDHRQSIRDWSFIKDVNTVVTAPKPRRLALHCELENLTPLSSLEDWEPSEDDMRIVKMFYDETLGIGESVVGGSETSESADENEDGLSLPGTARRHGDSGYNSISSTDSDNTDSSISSDSEKDSDDDDDVPNTGVLGLPNPEEAEDENGQQSDTISNPDELTDPEVNVDTDSEDDNPHQSMQQGAQNVATTTSSVGRSQHHINRAPGDDVDNESNASSGLFVSSGSGSSRRGAPSEPMDVDHASERAGDSEFGRASSSSRPGAGDAAGASAAGRILIDLTGDSTDDEKNGPSPSVRSNSGAHTPIKSEPDLDGLVDLAINDDRDNTEADSDMRDIEREGSQSDRNGPRAGSNNSNNGSPSSSSKRGRGKSDDSDSESDDEAPPAKRSRHGER
ncbi:hypothetical protein AAE478_007680 [Parahypoxylon ruwenzoriense]